MSEGSSALDTLTYLNMSDQHIVNGNSTWTKLINLPYRIGLSFSDATKIQYQQLTAQNTMTDDFGPYHDFSLFLDLIGYFFSKYAVICFITAIMLNRLIQMSPLPNAANIHNNNNNNVNINNDSDVRRGRLPLWSTIVLHLTALVPLAYVVIQSLVEVDIISENNLLHLQKNGLEDHLVRMFSIFSWSHCIETFITIMSNSKPMEESDYTIFELSIQFYIMSRQRSFYEDLDTVSDTVQSPILRIQTISDCLMAIFGRIIIHLVEIFDIKPYRLLISTIINIFYLLYLVYSMITGYIIYFPLTTYFRHFPKVFSILIVFISVLCYSLSCLVRKDLFGNNSRDTSELQYYSFMNNWWNHLHCTGEQEFSVVINKFALLLCKDVDSINYGVQKEFPSLTYPTKIHSSFMISGYNNKLQNIAVLNQIPSGNENNDTTKLHVKDGLYAAGDLNSNYKSSIKKRFEIILDTFINLFSLFKLFGKLFKQQKIEEAQHRTEASSNIDFHDYVTNKHYAKFLSRIQTQTNDETIMNTGLIDSAGIQETLLLPEEDLSGEYIPSDDTDKEREDVMEYNLSDASFSDDELQEENEDLDLEILDDIDDYDEENDKSSVKDELVEIILAKEPISTEEGKSWMVSMWDLFQHQMKLNKRLTRSEYSKLNPGGLSQDVSFANSMNSRKSSTSSINDDHSDSTESVCVVCKTNDRNIVIWPCRCFALCEDCRISLGLRGFNTCVCCRSEVHGYSKLNKS